MTTPSPAAPELPGLEHVQLLGSGGFADVHLYRQELPRMLVAVKVLRESTGADQQRQLVDEANAMAELAEHPYIVTVFRAGTTDDGRAYLVMAYLPRPNLAARARGNPLSVAEALRSGVQLASAVETAHRAGVLHRDIKPANVLVSSYGTPALADFGIAGRAETVHEDDEIGVSLAWAPPEVLRGHSNGSVAADVYSLTATIWYLLTGHTPFEEVGGDNSDRALLLRTTHEPPPRTGRADVPESLERLLQHGLAKDPAHRPRSALALATDLQRVEQELRLPRTEVVVLDRDDHDGLRTVTGTPTTVRSALPDDGREGPLEARPSHLGEQDQPGSHVGGQDRRGSHVGGQDRRGSHVGGQDRRGSHVGGQDRPGSRWPVLVLGAIVAALLVGAGVWVGLLATRGGDDQATSPTSPAGTPSSSAGTSTTSAATGEGVDPCLVGSWRTTEHVEQLGGITSLDRDVTITADGTMTITYDTARAGGSGQVFDGEVEYRLTTRDGTMHFELLRDDLTLDPPSDAGPGTSPVSYTCSGDSFTQSQPSIGFRSVYEKR